MTGINQRGRYGRYLKSVLTIVDFLILNFVFFVTLALTPQFDVSRPRLIWLLANLAYIPAAHFLSSIQARRTVAMENVFLSSVKAVGLHALLFISCMFFLQIDNISLRSYAEFYGLLFVLFPVSWLASRLFIKYYRRRGGNFARVVIVGCNVTGLRLYKELVSDLGFGYKVEGIFDNSTMAYAPDGLYQGKISELDSFLSDKCIDEVYCTLPGTDESVIAEVLRVSELNVARFYYVPPISSHISRSFDLFAIGSIPVLSVRHQPLMVMYNRVLKRSFDLLFSSVALVFFPLIFIPVAIAIKVSSPGPVFFRQKRTGYKGRDFDCLKFRTMRVNRDSDRRQATKNDPRKTRVGDFLRKTSIDELPQFINVLKGDMSVVGPRPHMLTHTEQYSAQISSYMVRHYIKPGITGWAQINGFRGQTEELWQMEERVRHDTWYLEHWTFLLDMKIIVRTVFNAVRGEKNAF